MKILYLLSKLTKGTYVVWISDLLGYWSDPEREGEEVRVHLLVGFLC